MKRGLVTAALALVGCGQAGGVSVGSKQFTESVILGEAATDLIAQTGAKVDHRRELGGTEFLWNALVAGEIDVYPEYTGTIRAQIFAGQALPTDQDLRAALAEHGIRASAAIGFNDSYAVGMKEGEAERLGIRTLSDLAAHPEVKLGFSSEFMERPDGWGGMARRYGFAQRDVVGLSHDLAYRGLDEGSIQATDVYTTDAEIVFYGLRVLEDDLHFFPVYDALFLYRDDLPEAAVTALSRLDGHVSAEAMRAMNARAKVDRVPETVVAADFLADELGLRVRVQVETATARLVRNTRDHLVLVAISLALAILFSIPLGVLAARRPRLGQLVLGGVGVLQTIPSLALLVFMIRYLGIGTLPAIAAMFLYSLLPIVRNTSAGIAGIPTPLRESADALGLSSWARLRLVELPMAAPHILAGIKTSAVINVGTATLGALIGAGGYGQPIMTGIRLADRDLILQGAVPAAVLALLVQGLFELAERGLVPRGLRWKG